AQEIRMVEDDPDYCLYYGLMKSLFSHNPMRDSVAGTVESISEITAGTLYDCHKVFYNPSNMALCVVGDVNPDEVVSAARKILPKEAGPVPDRDYGEPEKPQPNATGFYKDMEVSLPIFLAGCKVKPAPHGPETLRMFLVSSIALDVLAGHSSPLYLRLYEEGLVNSDFSASFDCAASAAYFMFGGEARDPKLVYDEVLKEITRLRGSGPDPELFRRIKKAAVGGAVRAFNSFESLCVNITEGHFRGYDPFEITELLDKISEQDITEFYRSCLLPENMAISVITPLE
ncbi:MAG: insulinase family protein, partial [Oscillospiraceae bacterium]|nr:insulinase family protein [Oscillospiraceae bacterium]